MLNNSDKIRVENRGNAIVGYKVPESNIPRRFVANEIKEIPMGELRQVIQNPGTKRTIMNNLIIHDKSAVEELLPEAEPEYFYTTKDVDFLLERGTLDQLKDALDFAPKGVVDLIKERAVKNELNDVRKREAILEATNFNVTGAIEINHLAQVENKVETKTRRTAPIGEESSDEQSATPTRRTAAPKYTIIK
jgi:predicted transcriptional regulator